MNQAERRAFVREHRTAVFGTGRKQDGPAMSIVYYAMDGDDLLISTMSDRAKARVVRRNPKVSLCVLDEKWPPSYLLLYADAVVETDFARVVDLMLRIAGVMAGREMPESVRPLVEEGARREKRVVLRCRPYATFHSPPKHVHQASDVNEKLLHDLGATLPW